MTKEQSKLIIYPTIMFALVVAIVMLMSFTSSASAFSTGLPYVVEDGLPVSISEFQNMYNSFMNANFGGDYLGLDWTSEQILAYKVLDGSTVTYTIIVPKSNGTYSINLNGTPYEDFSIDANYITVSFNHYVALNFKEDNTRPLRFDSWNFDDTGSIGLFGSYTRPIYISGKFYWGTDYVVLSDELPPVIVTGGIATPPQFSANLGADIGANIPNVPTPPTYNSYTFTIYNPPSFDSSSVTSALESLGDILSYNAEWLADNLKGSIDNLKNNIKSSIDYIGQLIEYTTRKIIDNIQNGIQNLYENFVSLFEPIGKLLEEIRDKIDYISQPLDTDTLTDALEDMAIYSDLVDIKDLISNAMGLFDDISEPNTYVIPIHLENIAILNTSTQYIDLGLLNPVKSILRAFMWCITTFGLLYTILDALPSYIAGGDE